VPIGLTVSDKAEKNVYVGSCKIIVRKIVVSVHLHYNCNEVKILCVENWFVLTTGFSN